MINRFVDAYYVTSAVNPLGVAENLLMHIQTVIDEGGHPANDAAIRLFIDKLADLHAEAVTLVVNLGLVCGSLSAKEFYTLAETYHHILSKRSRQDDYTGTRDLYTNTAAAGLIYILWNVSGAYLYQDSASYSQDYELARLAYEANE